MSGLDGKFERSRRVLGGGVCLLLAALLLPIGPAGSKRVRFLPVLMWTLRPIAAPDGESS